LGIISIDSDTVDLYLTANGKEIWAQYDNRSPVIDFQGNLQLRRDVLYNILIELGYACEIC